MFVAANENRLCTIAEAAERHRVSKNHLMKVSQSLVHEGWLESVRGRSGGLRLGRPAAAISIGDVVEKLEGVTVLDCMSPGATTDICVLVHACALKPALAEAMQAFIQSLKAVTLADAASPLGKVAALLGDAGLAGQTPKHH